MHDQPGVGAGTGSNPLSSNRAQGVAIMKTCLALLLLLPGCGVADYLAADDAGDTRFVGPSNAEVELLAVRETSPYASSHPLSARIRNHSGLYLDRLAIACSLTDPRGFRVFKRLIFKSQPLFSVRIGFPPVSTPEMGIPPGAEAVVGLYTDDNRWTRGHGDYRYDCQVYGVSGRE